MKRYTTILAFVFALAAIAQAQTVANPQTPQQREDVIRMTYAKLMFANQVGAIENYFNKHYHPHGETVSQVLQDNALAFELTNFKEGDVPCSQAPLSELASNRAGQPVLYAVFDQNTLDALGTIYKEIDVALKEGTGQVVEGYKDFVICDLSTLSNPGDPKWSKYVSYDVVATYKGNKTKYRASFAFDGTGKTMACDPYVLGITSYIEASVYPAVLVNWTINGNHEVAEWARANSSESVASKQIACDPQTLKCLMPAQDIVEKPRGNGLPSAPPIDCNTLNNDPEFVKKTQISTYQHTSGDHNFTPIYDQDCQYTDYMPIINGYGDWVGEECAVQLNVNSDAVGIETGVVHLWWHSQYSAGQNNGTQYRVYPENAYATSNVSAAFQSCFSPICVEVQVSWNGIGFTYNPSNPMWAPSDHFDGECPAEAVRWPT